MSSISYKKIAEKISAAEALLISAGSGMSVDSGLPDFGGGTGFWKAYPQYKHMGIGFEDVADLQNLLSDPASGWGFYGQRANLYRTLTPHRGFQILRQWIERLHLESFVITTNVDCQFQKAGFSEDRIYEPHGTVHHLQCTLPCCSRVWERHEPITVDEELMQAQEIPTCPSCGRIARPNVLMYGDNSWIGTRIDRQQQAFYNFMQQQGERRLVVIEIGAGTWVPTLRHLSERLAASPACTIIRINPAAPEIRKPHFPCQAGAMEVLANIDNEIRC